MEVSEVINSTAGAIGKLSAISLLYALGTLILCLIARKALLGLIKKGLARTRLDSRLSGLVMKILGAVMWFIIVLILCDMLGVDVTSLIALFSVAGLAFSLAIQDSLSNLAGGIMLLSSHPFKIGDYVEAGGQEGTVQSIGVIYTQLTTADNKRVYVPNSSITSGKIVNYSSQPDRRIEIKIAASYDDPTDRVKGAIMDAVAAEPRVLKSPEPTAAILEYGDSAVTYTLRVWVRNADYWPVRFALTEALRGAFDRAGVTMTYNHINVHMVDN